MTYFLTDAWCFMLVWKAFLETSLHFLYWSCIIGSSYLFLKMVQRDVGSDKSYQSCVIFLRRQFALKSPVLSIIIRDDIFFLRQ